MMLYPGGGYTAEYFPIGTFPTPAPPEFVHARVSRHTPPRREVHIPIRLSLVLDLEEVQLDADLKATPADMQVRVRGIFQPSISVEAAMQPADMQAQALLTLHRPDLAAQVKAMEQTRRKRGDS